MMKNYFHFFCALMIAMATNASAQCTSCTITISGPNSANHIVGPGNTLCITASGSASGLITVSAGGTLCNQGTINSSNLWVAGGTLNNHGTINTSNILTSAGGTFNNYGSTTVDSLLIAETNSKLFNYNVISDNRFGVTDGATATNNGTISSNYMGDSIGTVVNNGTMTINVDFGNGYTSNFTNNGNLTVNNDFVNVYSSTFVNSGYFKVVRDFYNSTSATFTMLCMGTVQRDWYNSATIAGPPTSSCGGFNVAGQTLNSGTIGTTSQHVDICDAGSPFGGMDGNIGTIASTTTYCACSNSCINTVGISQVSVSDLEVTNVFPNPSNNKISLIVNGKETQQLYLEVYDMLGKKKMDQKEVLSGKDTRIDLEISELAAGTYILSIEDKQGLKVKKMFNVVK